MAWYRCETEGIIKFYTLFENGVWQNTDLFDITLSETGAQYMSIVNGELVYGDGVTGFSVYSKSNSPFILIGTFYSSSSDMFLQTGRCVRGADARLCQESGKDRHSWHDWRSIVTNNGKFTERISSNPAATQAVFLSGVKYTIKSLYIYEYPSTTPFAYFDD